MKHFLFIMILVLECLLTGCRASKESKARSERMSTDEIGVVLRRVDSLSSTISEKQHIKVEFYPLSSEYIGWPIPASDTATQIGPTQRNGRRAEGGGVGSLKSIEITSETEANTHTNTLTDSTAVNKTTEAEALQKEKASEAKQDYGTVVSVAIVFAAALLIFLLIKTYRK